MPNKKPSLAETLGQRRQQSQPLEPVRPENPIAALQAATETVVEEEPKPERKRTRARTHTRVIPEEVSAGGIDIEALYRKLQARKHLSSYTFRFRAEELDEIDQIASEIEQEAEGKFSKNDLARLALLWFCEDYRANGEESILGQIISKA